jgi:hypothetical protein
VPLTATSCNFDDKLKINSVLKQCLAGRDYEIESFSGIQCLRNLFIIGSCEA